MIIGIISGKIKPGGRLPSVRELALMLKVNPNTLQKALQELEEIKLIYTLIRPKYAVPVHGEYKHLKAQAKIAQELGMAKENKLRHT